VDAGTDSALQIGADDFTFSTWVKVDSTATQAMTIA
jgi:hypothetical protein